MDDLLRRIIDLSDAHVKVGDQWEHIGDTAKAAQARAVANMLGNLISGVDTGGRTLVEAPDPAIREAIRQKNDKVERLTTAFDEQHAEISDAMDMHDSCAFQEAANRLIDMIVRFPAVAPRPAMYKGLTAALEFMRRRDVTADGVR